MKALVVTLAALVLGGCYKAPEQAAAPQPPVVHEPVPTAEEKWDRVYITLPDGSGGKQYPALIYIDPQTKCQYMVFAHGALARLKADGKPMCG